MLSLNVICAYAAFILVIFRILYINLFVQSGVIHKVCAQNKAESAGTETSDAFPN